MIGQIVGRYIFNKSQGMKVDSKTRYFKITVGCLCKNKTGSINIKNYAMRYLLLISLSVFIAIFSFRSPQFVVTGKVTDFSTGSPLAGVAIIIKGTNTVTTTGSDGKFSLTVRKENDILVFSKIGYDTTEVRATNDVKEISLSMKRASSSLNEVVVTGYETKRKKDVIGLVSVMHGKKMRGTYDEMGSYQPGVRNTGIPTGGSVPGIRKDKSDPDSWRYNNNYEREGYDAITENRFLKVTDNPLSTFSIDVDAASYSNIRRMLNAGHLPHAGAVRIEEMINYFQYNYPEPVNNDPFSMNTEMSECPWNTNHKLVVVGLQGKKISTAKLPPANIVFLVDVSGSMMDENKLPLVKQSLKLLADQIRNEDKVAIVVYAGNAGLVLPSVSGEEKTKIKDAIEQLEAGGSTAGGRVFSWHIK